LTPIATLFNLILEARAQSLAQKLRPHLPQTGRALDIGSGTGHTAQALRRDARLSFVEADVVNMSVVGAGPILFANSRLPFCDEAFACAFMTFVLQYVPDPIRLLSEARRVTGGRVLVLQSTYEGWRGRSALICNELWWGPVAFTAARLLGLIGNDCPFSLQPQQLFTRDALQGLFRSAGLAIEAMQSQKWPGVPVSYDLFVLEKLNVGKSPLSHHPRPQRRSPDWQRAGGDFGVGRPHR
jgi:SAM-dependent methyltransferase